MTVGDWRQNDAGVRLEVVQHSIIPLFRYADYMQKHIGRWRPGYDVQKDRLVYFYFHENENRVNAVRTICLGKSGWRGGKNRTIFFGVEIMLLHNANANSTYVVRVYKKHTERYISTRAS